MKKPDIKILPEAEYSRIYIIEIDGDIKYRCISKERAEAIEDMIDALIKARQCYQGIGDLESCGKMMSQIIPEIDEALKKAGCE